MREKQLLNNAIALGIMAFICLLMLVAFNSCAKNPASSDLIAQGDFIQIAAGDRYFSENYRVGFGVENGSTVLGVTPLPIESAEWISQFSPVVSNSTYQTPDCRITTGIVTAEFCQFKICN